jgi:hypothetical protein
MYYAIMSTLNYLLQLHGPIATNNAVTIHSVVRGTVHVTTIHYYFDHLIQYCHNFQMITMQVVMKAHDI